MAKAASALVERGALTAVVCEGRVVDERLQEIEKDFLGGNGAPCFPELVLGRQRFTHLLCCLWGARRAVAMSNSTCKPG